MLVIYMLNVKMNIDRKDREILFHLSLNARATLQELAKKMRVSKEVVHYRIRRLEEQKIIQEYYAIINTYHLGRVFYRMHVKTGSLSPEKEREFIDYLKQHPQVTWIVILDGEYNLLYTVWGKDTNDFQRIYYEINNRFGKYIQEQAFSIITAIYYFKHKFVIEKEDDTYQLTGGQIQNPTLEPIDEHLLSLLSKEGRLPLTEIARRLSTNPRVIYRHMKKLEEIGIITGYTTKINHSLLGYTQRKVMLKLSEPTQESIAKLTEFIKKDFRTIYITIAIGKYDFEFEMMERSYADFHELMQRLKDTFPGLVRDYTTLIFREEPKVGQLEEDFKQENHAQ